MRIPSLALSAILSVAGCKSTPPEVTVNTSPGGDVNLSSAYDVAEGSALDFVVDPGVAGAKVTASNLPKNATFMNNVFSFTPDYSQAGLYSVTFTITAGATVTQKVVAIRVLNVLHIDTPPITVVSEGSAAPTITFTNNEPMGTVVNYSANLTGVPGATFDPVKATLDFTPDWKWLDSNPAEVAITVTAETTEPDTGKVDTSTAQVLYQIKEATSFNVEIVPLFLYPSNSNLQNSGANTDAATYPQLVDSLYGHYCVYCHTSHTGVQSAPFAGMDFAGPTGTPATTIYSQLVNHPPSTQAQGGSCYNLDPSIMRVVPGDPNKSLWYLKISGTDGMGGSEVPCGAQMPEQFRSYYWTVSDQNAWNMCMYTQGDNACHDELTCLDSDTNCKLNARYVRKARLWIEAGAPMN